MRKLMAKGAGAAIVLAVLTAAAATAEAGQIRANIPFAFTVNKTQLAAGTYTITSAQGHQLLVRGATGGAFVLTNGMAGAAATPRKLVFHKYGERYVLRQVWMGGDTGRELPASPLEREYKRAVDKGGQVAVPAF